MRRSSGQCRSSDGALRLQVTSYGNGRFLKLKGPCATAKECWPYQMGAGQCSNTWLRCRMVSRIRGRCLIAAIIKDSEKKARDAETAARRQELAVRREQERKQREQKHDQERIDKRAEHKRKEKEKAFESLISLPSEQQETRLGELAQRLDEDVAVIRHHFTAFVGMESRAASTNSWNVELWPDPVETQALLQQISAKISKYIVLRREAVIATALSWHEDSSAGALVRSILPENSRHPRQD